MRKYEKILDDVLSGEKDNNIKFTDLCYLICALGGELKRISGDHYIFSFPGTFKAINIQPDKKDGSKAKRYQVKQVRDLINEQKRKEV